MIANHINEKYLNNDEKVIEEVKKMMGKTQLFESKFMDALREEGREEGELKKAEEIAVNLLKKGIKFEIVSEITGLSLEHVRELQSKV